MALICKPTVRFKRFSPALLRMISVLGQVATVRLDGWPNDLVITSVNDSRHMDGSRHYTDEAIDLRAKTFAHAHAKTDFCEVLRVELGPQFTVLHEAVGKPHEHFHIQVRKGQTYRGDDT